eukprot:TRINITY_DN81240_c0_g1_i1.p1 TRINITY_DN81240_c0_g1~~TRINITY_DN81240_c0_g1_i1.p1  ORF type:complete len:821 (-),score=204.62 TRINITY_DN81240_c0_g1_i1:314-2776(-)
MTRQTASPGAGAITVSTEAVLLAQLVQLVSQQPQHSISMTELTNQMQRLNLMQGRTIADVKTILKSFPVFEVSGPAEHEQVKLLLGPPAPQPRPFKEAPPSPLQGDWFSASVGGHAEIDQAMQVQQSAPAIQSRAGGSSEEEDEASVVQLRGLPYGATLEDLRAFLGRHAENVADDDSIQFVLNRNARPSGFAKVQFNCPQTAKQCCDELHMKHMGSRYVEVFLCSEKPVRRPRKEKGGEAAEKPPLLPLQLHSNSSVAELPCATLEQVVHECRTYMADPAQRRVQLSQLAVALPPPCRNYLKQADETLKQILARHGNEFAIEGGAKGNDTVVIYTPIRLSEALAAAMSPQTTLSTPPAMPPPLPPSAAQTSVAAAAAQLAAVDLLAAGGLLDNFPLGLTDAGNLKSPWPYSITVPPAVGSPLPPAVSMSCATIDEKEELPSPQSPKLVRKSQLGEVNATPMVIKTPIGCGLDTPGPWGDTPQPQNDPEWSVPSLMHPPAAAGLPPLGGAGLCSMPSWPPLAPIGSGLDANIWTSWASGAQPWMAWGQPPSFTGPFGAASSTAPGIDAPAVALVDSQPEAEPPAASVPATPEKPKASPNATGSAMIRLRGLPFGAKVQDIFTFFAQYEIVDRISDDENAVTILTRGPNGKPSGQATVLMKSPADAEIAQQLLNTKWIGNRYIEVFRQGDSEERLTPEKKPQPGGNLPPVPAPAPTSCSLMSNPWQPQQAGLEAIEAWDAIFRMAPLKEGQGIPGMPPPCGGFPGFDFLNSAPGLGAMPPLPSLNACAVESSMPPLPGLDLAPPAGAPVDGPNTIRMASLL